MEPLVALTRMVFGPVSCVGCGVLLLPQPSTHPRETTDKSRRHRSDCILRPSLLIRQRQNSEKGRSRIPIPLFQSIPAVCVALLVIEKLVVAAPLLPNGACDGLKLQVMPAGRPVQLKLTDPVIPYCELTCIVTAEDVVPWLTCRLLVDKERSMSGAFA